MYAPITIDEFMSASEDHSAVNLCPARPVRIAAQPPGQPVPTGTVFPVAQMLAPSGKLDSLTPLRPARSVRRSGGEAVKR